MLMIVVIMASEAKRFRLFQEYVTQYLSIVMREVNQIIFATLAINLYRGIKFLKNHMKFHQILIEELSLNPIKL